MTPTPIRLSLRAFDAADAPAVEDWFDEGGLQLPGRGAAWADRLVGDPRIVAFVAAEAGEPVGLLRLDCGPDGLAELTIVIAPGRRRMGRGRAVFEAALPHIRALGVRGLVAFVGLDNEVALRFFERLGFGTDARVGGWLRMQRFVHAGGPAVEPLEVET